MATYQLTEQETCLEMKRDFLRLKVADTAEKAARSIGHIDGHEQGCLRGWAYNPADATEAVEVRIFVDGREHATGLADGYRPDLEANGIGQGRHSFSIPLLLDIGPEETATVWLQDVRGGSRIKTNAFTVTRQCNQKVTIDGLDGDHLAGWIEGSSQSNNANAVSLLIDGKRVESANTVVRPDSTHYFRVVIPRAFFDGMPHALTVVVDQDPGAQAVWAGILPTLQTPWTYIASSALHNGYAGVPRVASYRYESLRHQLAAFAGRSTATPLDELRNIHAAHSVVTEGYEGRKKFPRIHLPMAAAPEVTVVIPVHNKFELTYHCLASLALAYNKASYEVIVVDDCSTDQTTELSNYVENVRIIVNEANLGFLLNCNKAAAVATGKYVVMLNNDTEVTTGWLDELIAVLEMDRTVGMVGSKLLYPDGSLQEAGGIVWSTGEPWNLGNRQNSRHPSFNYSRQADYLSGAAIMLPRSVWQEVGGFSEEFVPAYYEDTDLAFKVRDAGYKTVYCPFSEVIHFEGMSNGCDVKQGIKRHQLINEPKFRAKWSAAYRHNGKVGEDLAVNMDRGVSHRVLMIDYSIPRPDHDAGSYAAVQEMLLLQANGCKITFVADNMAHLGKYTDNLQRMGVECIYAPFYTSIRELLESRGKEFDVVYITRYDIAERHIDNVRKLTKAKVLFNNADLHFLREMRAAITAKKADLSGPLATRDRELALMRKVDAILSYNSTEHAVILSHNLRSDNLFLCPWVVEPKVSKTELQDRFDIAFLGGFHHAPNVEAANYFVTAIMPGLRDALPDVKFRIFGSQITPEIERLADEDVIIEGFVDELSSVFDRCRVFVAPLLSGAGIKGKVLDAMAFGVPMVLSPVAAEGTGLAHGASALICHTPDEWVTAIRKLYTDDTAWRAHSAALRQIAESQYSSAVGKLKMRAALNYLGIYPAQPRHKVRIGV